MRSLQDKEEEKESDMNIRSNVPVNRIVLQANLPCAVTITIQLMSELLQNNLQRHRDAILSLVD